MKQQTVSKSQFKAKALEYMRYVERHNTRLIVTDMGKPVVNIIPHQQLSPKSPYDFFKGSVLKYERPTDPVGLEEWEALK